MRRLSKKARSALQCGENAALNLDNGVKQTSTFCLFPTADGDPGPFRGNIPLLDDRVHNLTDF